MKCIECTTPNSLIMKDVECPVPGPDEALVRIRRIGICGTDLHAYRGRQPFFTYPRVLGHELSGEIAEVDANQYGLKQGDKVAIIPYLECGKCSACRNGRPNCCTQLQVLGVHKDGGMCEYITVPVDHLVKTNHITLDQAAVIEPLSIGAHAVRRAEMKAGDVALVVGAGPIGLGVMKFAKLAGATVIAMDINEERLQYCSKWVPADYTVKAAADPILQLEEITDGDLPGIVFDVTGNAQSMMNAFKYAAHGGKIVYVGLVQADITFHDPDFHKKELTLMGSRNATREDFEHVINQMTDGKIDAESYVTHRASFADMIKEYENWLKPETKVIKALVEL